MQTLRKLLEEVEAIDVSQVKAPEMPVAEGETVVGELDDNLKREFAAMLQADKVLEEVHEEVSTKMTTKVAGTIASLLSGKRPKGLDAEDVKLDPELYFKHREAHHRAEILDAAFWNDVRVQFPEANSKEVTAIREGFKVVAYNKPESEEDRLNDLFERFGGSPFGGDDFEIVHVGRIRR